jgi:hypothetical protein
MPSLQTARRVANAKNNGAKTLGQIYKEQSDWSMEWTWDADPQSRVGYIYDYMHDDQPDIKDHMTYENTTKTKIDVKLIVKSYASLDQDQPEFYCQFKPSQKVEFDETDELYYFETEYRKKYGIEFPIGMMLDLPDDRGIYRKWLICERELANQFPKYLILPIDYRFMWIEKDGSNVYKRKMWGVNRSQKSYTIGVYTDRTMTRPDNQQKAYLPLNPITEKLWYTDDESKNMRMVVSAPTDHPLVWTLTKIENASPLGIQTLTFYQNFWNDHTDYIEKDDDDNIVGMWANYFDGLTPTDPDDSTPTPTTSVTAKISSTSSTIKVSGSYKTINLSFYNESGEDITSDFENAEITWRFTVDGSECDSVIQKDISYNEKKIKLSDNYDLLGKILTISCTIFTEAIGYTHSDEYNMGITE